MKKLFYAFCALTFALGAFGAENDKVYKLKLASTFENTMPVLGDCAQDFKRYVQELSGGRIEVRIDTPTKHKGAFSIMDFVKSGQYDLGYTALYYFKGKDPKTMFWTAVPFGMTATEQHAWYYFGGGKELNKKLFDKYNMLTFPMGATGMQMGGWFKKEIKSLDDVKGLKIRIPGFGGEVWSKIGAAVNTIPVGELYMSLEMGTIDAVEWVSPVYDIPLGFNKVAKFYYTGWQEPAGDTQLLVNKSVYEKLPKDLQLIIETAAKMAGDNMESKGFYENSRIWAQMRAQYPDVQVANFPPEVMAALRKATDEILDSEAAKDSEFKEILDSQRAFQAIGREWNQISETAYLNKTSK